MIVILIIVIAILYICQLESKSESYTNVTLPNKYIKSIYPVNPDNDVICNHINKSLMDATASGKLSVSRVNQFWDDHLKNVCR